MKHIFPLFLTLFNIILTTLFTITLVPHIKDLDSVGLIRLQTHNIDRCMFQLHPAFVNDTQLGVHFDSDITDCVIMNRISINETLNLLKFMNRFPQKMMMKHTNNKRKQLEESVYNYFNTLYKIPFPNTFNNTHASSLLLKSNNVILDSTALNNSLANTISNVMIAISIMMSVTVICQIFYNFNTIILKKQQRKQLEITTEYNSLNQVCHEIRNSLLPIDMCLQEIVELNQYNNNKKYLQTMVYNMNYVKYILKRRLDYSKILKKQYILFFSCINLYEFVESYISTFNMYATEVNRRIEIRLSNLMNEEINIDTYLFHHLITNIMRNAIKYGRDDEVNVIIISSNIHNNIINIQIEDNGVGGVEINMKKKKLDNNSYCLGIPFVKNIMKLMPNGNIQWIDKNTINKNNMGTIVRMSFELNECTDTSVYDNSFNDGSVYDGSVYDGSVYDGSVYDGSVYDESVCDESVCDESSYTYFKNAIDTNLKLHIIDDSIVARKCLQHGMKKIKVINWTSINYYENAEQFFEKEKTLYYTDIILVDQNMESSGGIMKGTDFVLKMFQTHNFPGLIIMITGNKEHVEYILEKQFPLTRRKITVWEKPLPDQNTIMNVLSNFYNGNKN
tara:strand:- start:450 stop:2306 length:1857 start_codon:yes stop_codon:yes gene_type:complete